MENKKVNWFTRIIIICLSLFLIGLIIINFISGNNYFQINSGIITLIGFLIILALSEVYDNFNFGKILSLSKNLSESKHINEGLSDENEKLRTQLIQTVQNDFNLKLAQLSANTNINANGVDIVALLKGLGVVPAQLSEEEEEVNCKSEINETATSENQLQERITKIQDNPSEQETKEYLNFAKRRKIDKIIRNETINRYLALHQISSIELKTEVEFSSNFRFIDPIMDHRIIFDGYLEYSGKEYFFGVNTQVMHPSMDRLYIQLAKILFYRQFKNNDAVYTLLFAIYPKNDSHAIYSTRRYQEYFQPAIINNLLRIEEIKFTEEEITAITNSILYEEDVT